MSSSCSSLSVAHFVNGCRSFLKSNLEKGHMKVIKFAIGFCLALLLIALPLSQFQPSALSPLETMVVQQGGRKKPLDTVAKETVA